MASTSRPDKAVVPTEWWQREFVLNPFIVELDTGSKLRLQLPYFGTEIDSNATIRNILDAFATPASLDAIHDVISADDELVLFLVNSFILLPSDEVSPLARGLLSPAENPIGMALSWFELNMGAARDGVVIFRVPIDFAEQSIFRGSEGAQRVRDNLYYLRRQDAKNGGASGELSGEVIDFDLRRVVRLNDLRVFDVGDVAFAPGREGLEEVGWRIGKIVQGLLAQKTFPITLGGDHSISFYILKEIFAAYGAVGVIHFDAHTDLYMHPQAALNELNHANVFQYVRRCPELEVLLQVGVRDAYVTPPGITRVRDARVRYLSAFEAQCASPEQVCKNLSRDIPYYLSFDVDVLEPVYAPETGTPVPGGLNYYQALKLIDYMAANFRLVGADFVEIGNSAARHHGAAEIVARYILTLILHYHSATPLGDYVLDLPGGTS